MNSINQENNMFGCFISGPSIAWDATQEDEKTAEEKGQIFRQYIWGDSGIDSILGDVINIEYGNDVKLILFQFYINPLDSEIQTLSQTEGYRKREKSIGTNIIATEDNFFLKNNDDRLDFLKSSILSSLIKLSEEYNDRLDTRFDLLVRELKKLFNYSENYDMITNQLISGSQKLIYGSGYF